jgi:transposase
MVQPMPRMALTDNDWEKIEPLLPKYKAKGNPGRPSRDNRLIIEGILWIHRTGAPWRDLPKEFGPWPTVYSRFRRWTNQKIWDRIWEVLKKTKRLVNRI